MSRDTFFENALPVGRILLFATYHPFRPQTKKVTRNVGAGGGESKGFDCPFSQQEGRERSVDRNCVQLRPHEKRRRPASGHSAQRTVQIVAELVGTMGNGMEVVTTVGY